MNTAYIILLVFVLLAVMTFLGGYPVISRGTKIRNRHFETICKQWLKRLNSEATTTTDEFGGMPFYRVHAKKLRVRNIEGASWTISYPLEKRYLNLGLKINVEMIVHVYSLEPSKEGIVTTVFADLTEPTEKWWDSQHRSTLFPNITRGLQGKEQEFTLPTRLTGDDLIPQ
jgi:hypothetical protein